MRSRWSLAALVAAGVLGLAGAEPKLTVADLIKKLLAEKSTTLGLAVPGMVTGSPGMEGGRPEHYDVIAFERDGKTRVYAKR